MCVCVCVRECVCQPAVKLVSSQMGRSAGQSASLLPPLSSLLISSLSFCLFSFISCRLLSLLYLTPSTLHANKEIIFSCFRPDVLHTVSEFPTEGATRLRNNIATHIFPLQQSRKIFFVQHVAPFSTFFKVFAMCTS